MSDTVKFFPPLTTVEAMELAQRAIDETGLHFLFVVVDSLEQADGTNVAVILPRCVRSEVTESDNAFVLDVACSLSTVANVEVCLTPCGMVYCKVS